MSKVANCVWCPH